MYLKKLEISGFKSFAARTTLDFGYDKKDENSHGITAIVGPNGSGKSNIADAMRWVMGEQSMKQLRGKKAEDIIFAGSGKKARLGSARVTLYLDNSDKKIPLEFNEVAISRKIFRSGESEYLVNGSRVRLQDITDLLAKAGVGKESYAIINQGMADSILNASPIERRFVIEDAAGVKQYQIKKERSIRKLDSTKENISRVRGIIEEIKPHLKTLKRQADKAAQGEETVNKLRRKQNKLYSFLWRNFQLEKNTLNEEKEELGRKMNNVQREVDKINDELGEEAKKEKTNNRLSELERNQREEKNKLNRLDRDLIITEGRIEIEKEKQKNIEIIEEIKMKVPPVGGPVDLQYVRAGIEEVRRDQEILIKKIEEVEKLEDLQEIKEFARVIQQRLYDLRVDIEKGRIEAQSSTEVLQKDTEKKISESSAEREINKSKEAEASLQTIARLHEKAVSLREEIKSFEETITKAEKEIEDEISLDKKRRQRFFELDGRLRSKQEELDRAKDKFNDSKISLARLEVREDDLKNQIREELKTVPEELKLDDEEMDQSQLEHEIGRLKIQLEQIGGIDPLVVEEYDETSKRFDFLSHELEDLEKAIVTLREVIREMDQKISRSFEETYTEINKEFTKYFRIIFGGGQAHLSKFKIKSSKLKVKDTDIKEADLENESEDETSEEKEDEREEVGIDISACPPGKKIANLNMLSGGERSLTSLALLFAIIAHNPPPFSVLDEVEAALDEANSKRFGRIISELSNETQFVIITHNRETMRQASMLYGVTMGEDGMSKMLSVRLDQVGMNGKIMK